MKERYPEEEHERCGTGLTIREAVERAAERLRMAGVEEARQDAWLLLAHLRSEDRATLLAHAQDGLGKDELPSFHQLVDRRAAREPLAQIVGRKEFWSLDFEITADVLCPRPDSECLIEAALKEVEQMAGRSENSASHRVEAALGLQEDQTKADEALEHTAPGGSIHDWTGRILDLGTGSGCLLLTLLSELPKAFGVGADLSMPALSIARANGERLGLADKVSWLCSDWGASLDGCFDLIISNPPYIAQNEVANLAPEIRQFEPDQALFAGEDGLSAYRRLQFDLHRLLAPGGAVCLEIGAGQALSVEGLLSAHGFVAIRRRQDLAGIDRCLIAKRN